MLGLQQTIFCLNLWGINPLVRPTKYTRLRLFINSLIIFMDLLELIFELTWNWEGIYSTLSGAIEVASSVLQVVDLFLPYKSSYFWTEKICTHLF